MAIQHYQGVLRDLAPRLGVDADAFANRQSLLIGAALVKFFYLGRADLCRVAVALPRASDAPLAYRWMLEANHDRSAIDLLPVLAIDPDTDQPCAFFHVSVLQADAAEALANLVLAGLPTFLLGWQDACVAAAAAAVAAPQSPAPIPAHHHLGSLA